MLNVVNVFVVDLFVSICLLGRLLHRHDSGWFVFGELHHGFVVARVLKKSIKNIFDRGKNLFGEEKIFLTRKKSFVGKLTVSSSDDSSSAVSSQLTKAAQLLFNVAESSLLINFLDGFDLPQSMIAFSSRMSLS